MHTQRQMKTGKARYMQIGARIGFGVAALAELVIGAYFGLIGAILAALAVPFVGEAMDCLALVIAILLAVVGFYIGMLIGLIVWGISKP